MIRHSVLSTKRQVGMVRHVRERPGVTSVITQVRCHRHHSDLLAPRKRAPTAARVARGDLAARLPEQRDSDLAPLAATFNRTAADLEERVARDARFAADVSHELRSPLTTMINAAAVLNRRRAEFSDTAQHAPRVQFQKIVHDGLVGTDYLERYRFTVDLSAGVLVLEDRTAGG